MTERDSNSESLIIVPITEEQERTLCRGEYQKECLYYGHIIGILAGQNLKGNATKYRRRYAKSRANLLIRVHDMLKVQGQPVLIGDPPRWTMVWTDKQGRLIRFIRKAALDAIPEFGSGRAPA